MDRSAIKIEFVKMSGAGNDFILIDNLDGTLRQEWSILAPKLCDRRRGVGADGLLIVEKSDLAQFKMSYFNSDGSFGGMCGNGGRCASKYVMDKLNIQNIRFEALDFVYSSMKVDKNISLQMKDVIAFRENIRLDVLNHHIGVHFLDTGAPHAILLVDQFPSVKEDLFKNGVCGFGRAIRFHREFSPLGTNVDFIGLLNSTTISMRTYERGVEDETLACGTGAVASALCSSALHRMKSPITVQTRGGEALRVYFKRIGNAFEEVCLEGSATTVFEGSLTCFTEDQVTVSWIRT
jgi:diaminopimelate epimerase